MRKTWLVIPAAACLAAALAAAAAADSTGTAGTIYACVSSTQHLVSVNTAGPEPCPSGAYPVSWAGTVPVPSPSPSATSPSPSLTATPPSPSPTGTTAACVTSSPSGTCGAYDYPGITNSNGYNTYVANNCWADPSCAQTVTATDPGSWSVSADEPTEPGGNTYGNCADGVKTYPDVQQLFNDWNGSGWNGPGTLSDTPLARLASLTSSYAEAMPQAGVVAQGAYDIWLSGTSGPGEVMVWVDNVNRGDGGAVQKAAAVIGGQQWTLYEYGTGEAIWSLGAPGAFANQASGTVDLLALLNWMVQNGYESPGAAIGQLDFGWEICSTGGVPETFAVSQYGITAAAA